jgi:hypothetical protein
MLRYRGRTVTDEDVAFIRAFIAQSGTQSRWALSRKLCEAWGWVRPNGTLCDMVCRSLLLKLERSGQIELPAKRRETHNPLARRRRPAPVEIDCAPVRCGLGELRPVRYRQVRRTPDEALFNGLIEQHHYLGYTQPVGAHLKYLVLAGERPVAALSFSSAPRHLGPRDRFIGWSPEARRQNLHSIAYNPRFLILPWVEVPHLASHVLGAMARIVASDWRRLYGQPLHFLETFIDLERYRGTCYRAANWVVLGTTTGRGHNARTKRPTRSIKQVLGYPLTPRFRQALSQVR